MLWELLANFVCCMFLLLSFCLPFGFVSQLFFCQRKCLHVGAESQDWFFSKNGNNACWVDWLIFLESVAWKKSDQHEFDATCLTSLGCSSNNGIQHNSGDLFQFFSRGSTVPKNVCVCVCDYATAGMPACAVMIFNLTKGVYLETVQLAWCGMRQCSTFSLEEAKWKEPFGKIRSWEGRIPV